MKQTSFHATYLEKKNSRLHIMWICHCNVGKTNKLKQNGNENIWCHQNMNRKKGVIVFVWHCHPTHWKTCRPNYFICVSDNKFFLLKKKSESRRNFHRVRRVCSRLYLFQILIVKALDVHLRANVKRHRIKNVCWNENKAKRERKYLMSPKYEQEKGRIFW
jgi:hypothetical protein